MTFAKQNTNNVDDEIISSKSNRTFEQKVVLEWENINYSCSTKDDSKSSIFNNIQKERKILDNISGRAESGDLLAILGPTGCGKTSLLNILAGRSPTGGKELLKLEGNINVNGKQRNEEKFRRMSAYVLQDDNLYPHLTISETLELAAHFFLPTSYTDDEKNTKVNNIINELGLVKARDTIIGNEKVRGVSGGERKRASVAVQLISDPVVLFLDEPTSGIDSFQAQSVMESMKSLSLSGRLVICVVHQPRSSIFEMFDKLLLLSLGRSIYLGNSSDSSQYFANCGYEVPKLFNPSDFFLDIISPDNRNEEVELETSARISKLYELWDIKAIEDKKNNSLYTKEKYNDVELTINDEFDIVKSYRNFKLLMWRSHVEQTRDIKTIIVKIFLTLFFGFIIAGIYSETGHDQTSIYNRTGILFVTSINQCFNCVFAVLNTFPKEKSIVNRERSNNAYSTFSYFVAKYLIELPINLMPCLLFSCVVYWIANLNPLRFGEFLLIIMLEACTSISLGLAISAFTNSVESALALGPPLVIIAILFGGFYINIESLPPVADLIPMFSLLKWTFEAMCINEFKGQKFTCEDAFGTCETTGEDVLERLTFGGKTVNEALFGLSMVFVGFTLSAYFFLEISSIKYLKLGHIGSQFAKLKHNNSNNIKFDDKYSKLETNEN
jgi:ABC-type multidrug transport system ATPase subunit